MSLTRRLLPSAHWREYRWLVGRWLLGGTIRATDCEGVIAPGNEADQEENAIHSPWCCAQLRNASGVGIAAVSTGLIEFGYEMHEKRSTNSVMETTCKAAMSTSIIENVEATILAHVIAPESPTLPAAVAAELLKWGFPEYDKQRMSELAAKARLGALSAEEQAETEVYERVSSFLGLVKSKARALVTKRFGPLSDGPPDS